MIPLLVSGVFIAVISVLLEKSGESSDEWADRQEWRQFQQQRDKQLAERAFWMNDNRSDRS